MPVQCFIVNQSLSFISSSIRSPIQRKGPRMRNQEKNDKLKEYVAGEPKKTERMTALARNKKDVEFLMNSWIVITAL